MSQVFIIDTNVVVSGLITSNPDSPVAVVLDGMLSAAFAFAVSESLLAEYREMLLRPHIHQLHGLSPAEVDTILLELAQHAIVLSSPADQLRYRAPDPGDQFLWDLLASHAELVLVTGDKLLLQDPAMATRVITPQALMPKGLH
ncbi:MAG: putative toxin-antitoxin system toxin component, PIN family [Rhodoferax sp.]|nr:putative toxin-antitoxin system toxin component, PIN family [Rhodoferax sp.]